MILFDVLNYKNIFPSIKRQFRVYENRIWKLKQQDPKKEYDIINDNLLGVKWRIICAHQFWLPKTRKNIILIFSVNS